MTINPNYRAGLNAERLVHELRCLLAAERNATRLVCRYLADLADLIEARATAALARYADIFEAARSLLRIGAHGTRERVRVGKALRNLPQIEQALIAGDLSYSRVREITRVATTENERMWLELARSLPMRQLEHEVVLAAGCPADPRPRTTTPIRWTSPNTVELRLTLTTEAWALVERAMECARRDSAAALSDAEALAAIARAALVHRALRDGQGRSDFDQARHAPSAPDDADPVPRDGRAVPDSVRATTWVDDDIAFPTDGNDEHLFEETAAMLTTDEPAASQSGTPADFGGLPPEARTILEIMRTRNVWTPDSLIDATGLEVSTTLVALTELEVAGYVKRDFRSCGFRLN